MKVLHFYKSYWPDIHGGVAQVIHTLAQHGNAHGIDVEVLALEQTPKGYSCRYNGHTVHKVRQSAEIASAAISHRVFQTFRSLAKTADLIHYHYPWPVMDLAHFYARHNKPSIVTYHSDIIKQKKLLALYRPLMTAFLNQADRIVATSPNYMRSSPVLQRFEQKTEVIALGLNQLPAPGRQALQAWRNRFAGPFILFVGALRYYKGLDILLQAAGATGLPIVIAGAGRDRQRLQAQARGLNCSNVHFVGKISDIDKSALLSLCTALVLPSNQRSEAFGLALVEAAMFGKPMISCEIGTGTSYVNLHEKTGLVVAPSDPAALAQAMNRIAQSPDQARAWGQNARQRYETAFSGQDMATAYRHLYSDVLETTAGGLR